MSDSCPTVRVKSAASPDGVVIINESDFDSAVHELAAPLLPPPPAPLPPPPAAPDPLGSLGKDWKSGDVGPLKKLAETVSGRSVENKGQAIAVIEAALAKRAAA